MTTETQINGTAEPADDRAPDENAAIVEWALWLARRGLRVHPLHWPKKTALTIEDARCSCNGECGKSKGKHPRLIGWQEKATTDERTVRGWWREWPDANVGIYTGAGEFFVLDEDGDEGRATREALERDHGGLPPTFAVGTGRGAHRYFAKPADTKKIANSVKIAPGLDVRADGGNGANAVGAGSTHWSGRRYVVRDASPIAPAPDWLLKFVMRPASAMKDEPDAALSEQNERFAAIPMSTRRSRAAAYLMKADPAVSGDHGHNDAMRVATAAVRGFALDKAAAREVLEPWNDRCLPSWSASELEHKIDEAIRVGAMPWGAKLLVSEDASFVFRSARQIAEPRPPASYVLAHFQIGLGRPTVLGGYGGVGKTILAQALGLAIATADVTVWGDVSVQAMGRVVHLDYEMGSDALERRYRRLARGLGVDLAKIGDHLKVCSMPRLYLSDDRNLVEAALIEACDGAVLAVIDSLLAACPGAKCENDSAMRLYLDMLTRVSLATGCAILVLAHEGKPSGENGGRSPQHRLRGSSAIFDAANTVLSVSARRGVLQITQTKAALAAPGMPVLVRFADADEVDATTGETGRLRVETAEEIDGSGNQTDADDDAVERAKLAIIAFLRDASAPPGVRELLRDVKEIDKDGVRGVKGFKGAVTKQALEELRASGGVVHDDGPRGSKLLRLASGGDE